MKTVVCVKVIGDELNPFDACALECALAAGLENLTVLSLGPERVRPVLESLTRLGTFRVVQLCDGSFAGSDTLATGYILAAAIRKLGADLVLCGRQSIDGDTAQVGPELAARLGFALVPNVLEFSTETCRTRTGPKSLALPAVATIERINTLRFPSIRSKKREIEVWDRTRLDVEPDRVGLTGSPTRVLHVAQLEHPRRRCRFIEREQLRETIEKLLRSKPAKANAAPVGTEKTTDRFKTLWYVGSELRDWAKRLSSSPTCIEPEEAENLVAFAERIERERPPVVLFPASLWGRAVAPQLAAMLETGLCADCTDLARRGGKLIMYRPAGAGQLYAEIECRTLPQMATVRTIDGSSRDQIVLGCGKGIADDFERAREFAKELGAGLAASRGLVDIGIAPYELQTGLTGRAISPKIYIAAGISGAVHHMCGVERSQYIVAINVDRHARIFDFADYGVVGRF